MGIRGGSARKSILFTFFSLRKVQQIKNFGLQRVCILRISVYERGGFPNLVYKGSFVRFLAYKGYLFENFSLQRGQIFQDFSLQMGAFLGFSVYKG